MISITEAVLTVLPCRASLPLQLCLIVFRFVCCCVTATIQPSILTTSLGLTLLPICSVCCCVTATVTHQLVMLADSELTSSPPAVLTDWLPSLSTPSALRSLSMPFQLMALHDPFGLLATTLAIVYSVYSAYLPGLHAARPSAFVEGEGFEPPPNPSSVMRCFQPLSQPSLSRTLRFCRKDNHLNTFKSSYIPLAIFSAISC